MNGRAIASFLFGLVMLAILVSIGAGIYQAGVTQGVIDAGRFPAGGTVPVAGNGWQGPGLFGLLFGIFFLFLIFGLLRAAFSRGRGWGPGGGHHGYGYGPGWGKGFGPESGPDAWREERERRIAELHKRLHDEGDAGSTSGSPAR